MATTTNYAITYPVSTDLVANGATAMGTIATTVDTIIAAQTQAMSSGFRNQLLNPTFSLPPLNTTFLADSWLSFVDSAVGVTNTRNTLGITALLPEWVTGSMTQATASNAAGIARYVALQNTVPTVTALSGQTVLVSFYAKAAAGTPKVGANLTQYFGTGGAPSADVVGVGQSVAITTGWARYSFKFTVASAAGKTVGTSGTDGTILRLWTSAGSNFNTASGSIGLQTSTIDITGVQVELSYLTPLEIKIPNRNGQQSSNFSAWTTITPTLSQAPVGALTKTTNYAAYQMVGKTCFYSVDVTATQVGAAGQPIFLTLTGAPTPKTAGIHVGTGLLKLGGAVTAQNVQCTMLAAGNALQFTIQGSTTGSITLAVAVNDTFKASGFFEIA